MISEVEGIWVMIMKAAVGERGMSAPVNDTLETPSAPSFRKSNLWPLRSSWICTSDQGIPLPNTMERAGEYAGVRRTLWLLLLCLFATHTYTVYLWRHAHKRAHAHTALKNTHWTKRYETTAHFVKLYTRIMTQRFVHSHYFDLWFLLSLLHV